MNPIILNDNRFMDAIPTATGTAAGYDVLNIRDMRPYTWWRAAAAGTSYLTVDCGSAAAADCLAVIGHNLLSAGALISLETSLDNAAWTQRLAPFTPTSNRAFLRPFVRVYARYWRIKIVTAAVAPQLAVVMIGERIDFPFPPDSFAPYSESVEVESTRSKTGNPLGEVVRYFPVDVKPVFSHVDRVWVEETYRPFREDYSRYRKFFFWAWDTDTYPDQVFFLQDVGKYDPTVSVLAYYDKLKLDLKGVMER